MSESKRSAARLFNSLALSDVKTKYVYKGQTREYHAHKAVFCLESEYFFNAFTSSFKISKGLISN
ncbi:hypothetical protein G6011_03626 [Alternaria panax]|uniref:BTB domain-containing protein n=1 Tax=Alternaria panax TaxID=48097 RepID=A0AAD4IFR4_9PLEO|nr:hypothetical protein G6011_03626 [Alternaria panax]